MNEKLQKLRESPHWSFSSLNGFINICSLQWAFRYFYKLEAEKISTNLVFGSAFHRAASWVAIMRMKDIYPEFNEVQDIFSEFWNLECRCSNKLNLTSEEQNLLNSKGRQMINCLNSNWIEDNILAIGKAFSVLLPGTAIPLIGEIDIIIKNNDERKILIDWKTSSRKWSADKADKDLQATCFMYAYEQIDPRLYSM